MTLSSILVATDFSLDSDAAVSEALRLARTMKASLHVLHVVDNPMGLDPLSSQVHTAAIAGLKLNLAREAKRQLRRGIRALGGTGITVTSEVRTGRPANEIVACARERKVDLIVIGSHGRTGVSRLILGSVAEHVVRSAPCAVLIIRPPAIAEGTAARSA